MIDFIQNNLTNIGGGLALLIVLGIAVKKIPSMLEEKARVALEKLFSAGDAADDAFLVAAINWAEAKYGPGSGEVKANAVVDKIISLIPLPHRLMINKKVRARAVELFQQSFDRLEKAALEARSKAEPQK